MARPVGCSTTGSHRSPRGPIGLELSLREAAGAGQDDIGNEHMLGPLDARLEGVAVQVLVSRADNRRGRRQQQARTGPAVDGGWQDQAQPPARCAARLARPAGTWRGQPVLHEIGLYLRFVKLAQSASWTPSSVREPSRAGSCRSVPLPTKNNPVLIGEPGVGKTAIVEVSSQKIVSGDVPETIKGKQLYTLDLTGCPHRRLRGALEEGPQGDPDRVTSSFSSTSCTPWSAPGRPRGQSTPPRFSSPCCSGRAADHRRDHSTSTASTWRRTLRPATVPADQRR